MIACCRRKLTAVLEEEYVTGVVCTSLKFSVLQGNTRLTDHIVHSYLNFSSGRETAVALLEL